MGAPVSNHVTTLSPSDHRGIAVGYFLVGPRLADPGPWRVYEGRSLVGSRPVEIKIMRPEYGAALRRSGVLANPWLHDLRVASDLGANLVVRHLDAGTTPHGEHYLVREPAGGRTLLEALAAGPLPLPVVAGYIADAAAVVDRAHQLGFCRIDLRPECFAELPSASPGEPKEIRLVDLGTLAFTGSSVPGVEDPAWAVDALYLAPEEAAGGPFVASGDVYRLGALLYELLHGSPHLGMRGRPRAEILATLASGNAPLVEGAMAEPLGELLTPLLSRDPAARPRDVTGFLWGLYQALRLWSRSNPQETLPPSLWSRLER
jgi:serine/threonine protein kinase